MNKIIILLISCSFLGIASSGSLFFHRAHGMYEQESPTNHMATFSKMTQQELLRQKFVLDILFHVQDRLQNTEQLMQEYGIREIQEIRPEMCLREMDDQMQYMMDFCNKCMQADTYSLSYSEEMRQIMGLYRLFVTARDFETLQQMSLLARKCIMGKIFVLAFVSAIRDRPDSQMLIIPKMYEIMPEAYYTEGDMAEIQKYQTEHVFTPMNMPEVARAYFDKSYLWMPYREMHRQIMLQKMRGKMGYVPMPVNLKSDRNFVLLENKMQNQDSMELFMEDLDLRAHVDSMFGHMMRLMEQDGERKKENEMRMRGYMQENNIRSRGMGVSDSISHMNNMKAIYNAHDLYMPDMKPRRRINQNKMYMSVNNELPTRNINDERLLHVGRRHRDYSMNQAHNWPYYMMSQRSGIREAHSVVDAADPRGLEALDTQNEFHPTNEYMKHPYSYYLEQQYHQMREQMQMGSHSKMYGMRHKRSTELSDEERHQSARILFHNIGQLMARFRMERMSMGESENMMGVSDMGMSNVHDDLDRMRVIRLNKMRLDTRQARLLLEHFKEMERLIKTSIDHEMQNQMENGQEQWDFERIMINILRGKIQGVSIMQMLDDLQKEMMPQKTSQDATQMGSVKRNIYTAVMMHFLSRMDHLMQQYYQNDKNTFEVHDLMYPSVTINQLNVDKLRTFVDHRDDDLVNLMHCKNLKSCLDEGKVMYARQPRLNHKTFEMKMQMVSERAQNVIMRTFMGRQMDADFMLMDTRVVKLQQGPNDIKLKSSDIMWTLKSTTSYSQLYKYVMLGLQDPTQMPFMRNQNCHFPHHLLLPRGHMDGLPVKIVVVVSPMDDNMSMDQGRMMCAMGIGNVGIDQHFYDFHLNRYIKNSQDMEHLMNMPNIYAQDVLIYHE